MKIKPYSPKKIMDSQKLFGKGMGPRAREADIESNGLSGIVGKVFHTGWKTTFMFSAIATACVYFAYIADSRFASRHSLIALIFIVIYALITKLMVNVHARKREKD
jgi:hypothetical protein